jgi:hypothetical protein
MTTPQWTVDAGEEGGLLYGDDETGIDVGEAFVYCDDADPRVAAARAALVADVAAARLVDDMAARAQAVVDWWEREAWPPGHEWPRALDELRSFLAGEVAALHHARRQEGT